MRKKLMIIVTSILAPILLGTTSVEQINVQAQDAPVIQISSTH